MVSAKNTPIVGLIGLGIIGSIWAKHYKDANLLCATWNRTPKPEAPFFQSSPLALAQKASIIHMIISDTNSIRNILQQILPALGPSKIIIQSGTIGPQSSNEFKALVTATKAQYLEAPFAGSKPAALSKQGIFYLGGDAALIDRLTPVLQALTQAQHHVGTNAQAAAIKLALNLNAAGQMQAFCEALSFARSLGISDNTYFAALKNHVSNSPLADTKARKVIAGDFSPQFSIKHLVEDVLLSSAIIGDTAPYPLLETIIKTLINGIARGYGEEDACSIIRLFPNGNTQKKNDPS